MSNELIGIIVVGGIVVAAIIYYLHSAKGAAELATVEAKVTGAVSQVQAQVQTAVADIKGHVTATAAANVPPAPTQAPAAPQVIVVPQPAPAAPVVAPPAPAPVAPPALTGDTNNGVVPSVGGSWWGVSFGTANPNFPRSQTSASFTLPAGTYLVGGGEGLQDGTASLSLSFAPSFRMIGGSGNLVLPTDVTGTATITASAPCMASLEFHTA